MTSQRKWGTQATRRQFMGTAAAFTAFSIVPRHVVAGSGQSAPSDKMNLGCVGVGGMQGANDVGSVSSENIYALCDVDENFLNKTAEKHPQAKKYSTKSGSGTSNFNLRRQTTNHVAGLSSAKIEV